MERKRARKSGKVFNVSNVKACPTFIHPDYRIELCEGVLGETGRLEILKLVPKSTTEPYFTARWDQKPEHLDIDIHRVSNSAKSKFRNNRGGYEGHHTS